MKKSWVVWFVVKVRVCWLRSGYTLASDPALIPPPHELFELDGAGVSGPAASR